MGIKAEVKGGERLRKVLRQLAKEKMPTLTIGIHSDDRSEVDGQPLAPRAFYNEFGTVSIPARPAMRLTLDKHEQGLVTAFETTLKNRVTEKGAIFSAGEKLGDLIAEAIQMTIHESDGLLPLQDSTIKAKKKRAGSKGGHVKGGAEKPLIDTGEYIRHIESRVEE